MHEETGDCQANPLQQVDQLYSQLVAHYGDVENARIRAASKLLIVALEKFKCHGGPDWLRLINEYLALAVEDPGKFDRIIRYQRNSGKPRTSPPKRSAAKP
ncbi:hypothetical protein DESC_940028 [Desulfosarcina cetonica]|uniref:hypothetical protein n=1 Tax=Desulfosarcina cetonica TaxID=90730 RepID=UPI0006D1B08F|nr:hypothetical protein [Desulfosarcina cetonica]VTR71413.1 hypothetical protein DESC_940028 [Desulfosarcina cetonica]